MDPFGGFPKSVNWDPHGNSIGCTVNDFSVKAKPGKESLRPTRRDRRRAG